MPTRRNTPEQAPVNPENEMEPRISRMDTDVENSEFGIKAMRYIGKNHTVRTLKRGGMSP